MRGSGFAFLGGKGGKGGGAVLLFQELDLHLGVLEAGFADLEQLVPLFEAGNEFGQRHVARLHRIDDGFEPHEGIFKGEFVDGLGVHGGHDEWGLAIFNHALAAARWGNLREGVGQCAGGRDGGSAARVVGGQLAEGQEDAALPLELGEDGGQLFGGLGTPFMEENHAAIGDARRGPLANLVGPH